MWRLLLRPLLFRLDAERAHAVTMALFRGALLVPGIRWILRRICAPPRSLQVTRFGRTLPGPVGLAAGFDKDARAFNDLATLGFGFIEVGTLTARPQPGNEKPRLFRLPADRALVNRFGFNNRGSAAAAAALAGTRIGPVLGVNIGKSKATPNEEAAGDYLASLERLAPFAAYLVVNVSSPNTKDLRQLQGKDALTALLAALAERNRALAAAGNRPPVPLFVKIAPDLTEAEAGDIVELVAALGLAGIVATNTTVSREGLATPAGELARIGAGGLSGAPLTARSRAFVRMLYRKSNGRFPIIGVGGVMDGDDAWELLRAGASLVQVYTGFIYGGPLFVRGVHRGIARRLAAHGGTLDEVIGEAARLDD